MPISRLCGRLFLTPDIGSTILRARRRIPGLGTGPRSESAGFGFLVLFNGTALRATQERSERRTARTGGCAGCGGVGGPRGIPRWKRSSFSIRSRVDACCPKQKAYIYAWVDGVTAAGFRAGIYCSGQPSPDAQKVVTAEDIRQSAGSRQITYWAINDACPPAPGCAFPQNPPRPAESGIGFAEVWQFAQSPQRKDVAGHCTNYSHDGNCYPPGTSAAQGLHVDLETATSPDPSHGRTH